MTQLGFTGPPVNGARIHQKKLQGTGQPILYLDFDGVLHPEDCYWYPRKGAYLKAPGHALFEHIPVLERLLEPFPSILIVLSTSWVLRYRFSGTVKKLNAGLRSRVVGATFHTAMDIAVFQDIPRGAQIQADVSRRQPVDWVALDDDDLNWPIETKGKFVHTDGMNGLGDGDTQALLSSHLERISKNCS